VKNQSSTTVHNNATDEEQLAFLPPPLLSLHPDVFVPRGLLARHATSALAALPCLTAVVMESVLMTLFVRANEDGLDCHVVTQPIHILNATVWTIAKGMENAWNKTTHSFVCAISDTKELIADQLPRCVR
jgi:hypothetical protein